MKITLIACTHGDETFGLHIIEAIKNIPALAEVQCVIANPQAIALRKRAVNEDLNRCFTGCEQAYEQQRVQELKQVVHANDIVIDVHNTTTSVKNALIVTNLSPLTQRVINAHPGEQIAYMPTIYAKKSLIGQKSDGAVSVEYSFEYAQTTQALQEMVDFLKRLVSDKPLSPRPRMIYYISGTIPQECQLPEGDRNYTYIPEAGGYGFLVDEKAYKGVHRGFIADKRQEMIL